MASTIYRTRLVAIVLLVIVIASSIALRKAVSNQTTRMAIGGAEIAFIVILVSRIAKPRRDAP